MKNVLLLTLVITFLLLLSTLCSNVDYGGKDTHKVYGDGVYVILTHSTNDGIIRGINNRKYNEFIVDEIFAMEETDEMVYVYGTFTKHPIYAAVNIVNNKVKLYAEVEEGDTLCMTQLYNMIKAGDAIYLDTYEEFSDNEREIFERLKEKED